MDEYISRKSIGKALEFVTNDTTCPIHIAAYIDQIIAQEPGADVAPRSEVAREIFEEINKLYEVFDDYDEISIGSLRKDLAELQNKYMKQNRTSLEETLDDAHSRSAEIAKGNVATQEINLD